MGPEKLAILKQLQNAPNPSTSHKRDKMSFVTNLFLGVDLAWQSDRNHTGIAVLSGDTGSAELVSVQGAWSVSEVFEFIRSHASENTVIAIDAPLIIRNTTGQRRCETEIGRRFGAYDASAHTSNLTLYPNAGSVRLVEMLASIGFAHNPDPARDKHAPGRFLFEVYPHPAHVALFARDKIIKYKKGKVAQKRAGLIEYRNLILERLLGASPKIHTNNLLDEILSAPLEPLRGQALKQYEDKLDAIFCAYLAYYYWTWGAERCEMIGDCETGYIINPTCALD